MGAVRWGAAGLLLAALLMLAGPVESTLRFVSRRDPADVEAWWVRPMKPLLLLRSSKPRNKKHVTLLYHYTISRLHILEQQCRLWSGAISAAVYVPMLNGTVHQPGTKMHEQNVAPLLSELAMLYDRMQQGACLLDMGVYGEDLPKSPESPDYWFRMPTNSMRNMALMQAQTEIVVVLDADFLPGPRSFVDGLHDADEYARIASLLRDNRGALVLPAFEHKERYFESWSDDGVAREKISEARARTSQLVEAVAKQELVDDWRAGTVVPFHGMFHRFTNYEKWATTDTIYEIAYPNISTPVIDAWKEELYEPYVMLWREHLPDPLWDERFRGYHLNKVQGLIYLTFKGYRFFVHPGAYILHMPHTGAAKEERIKEMGSAKVKRLNRIWDEEFLDVQGRRAWLPVCEDHNAIYSIWHYPAK